MTPTLTMVSLNVERSKHLDRILPFLKKISPEVVCLQELIDKDIPRFEEALGAKCFYFPMRKRPDYQGLEVEGVGIFSKLPVVAQTKHYYRKIEGEEVPIFDEDNKSRTSHYLLGVCEIAKEDEVFRIGTTHFTWTPEGNKTDDDQRQDIHELIKILDTIKEFVICGDFNAARGGEIFSELASRYKDNVPLAYTTSIDGTYHRAGDLPYMVDGLFSTPGYTVSEVEMVSGLSDHCGLVAKISKA